MGSLHNPQYYMFTVLPFGLATACYAFTKLLRPLVRHWRKQGLRALVYMDDGIVTVKGREPATEASKCVRDDLARAGFIVNSAKSNWSQSQQTTWLGFVIDLETGCIGVPQGKNDSQQSHLRAAVQSKLLSARSLASIIGKIISMSLGWGTAARLMTRSLYAMLNQ